MRNSDIKKMFKAEADSIRPDFDAMLEKINAEHVERERVVIPEKTAKRAAGTVKGAKRNPWRNGGGERTAARPRMAVGAASFCCAFMMIIASVFAVGYFSNTEIPDITIVGADTYVSVNINPGVDFTVNKYNKITSAVATNSGGVLLITKLCDMLGVETLVGRELSDALVDVIDTAAKMGYIDVDAVGISNAMMISVIAESDEKSGAIKSDLAQESKKYFADNGIYAVVVTEYDNKKALVEEARKNNPELSEDASVGDLISSVEKNNADKSALQAEIEDARKNYETYLRKTFNENKDKIVNKEIAVVNNDIARLDKIIASLNDMLAERSESIAKTENTSSAYGTDEIIAAINEEIEAKTALYNKRIEELDNAQADAEKVIEENEAAIAAITGKIADNNEKIEALERKIAELNGLITENNAKLSSLNADLDNVQNSISGVSRVINFLNGEKKWLEGYRDGGIEYAKHAELVGAIIDEAIYYDIMLNADLNDADRIGALERAAYDKCRELYGVVTSDDNMMIKTIVGEFSKLGLSVFKDSFVTGTNAVLAVMELSSTSEISLIDALKTKELLSDSEVTIKGLIKDVEANNGINAESIIIAENNKLLLNNAIDTLNVERADAENKIAVNKALIEEIAGDKASEKDSYIGAINRSITKSNAQINKLALARNTLRVFRDGFKEGDRLNGYDSINAELKTLEDKLNGDIAKNDADALAKNIEIEIKNQADELFNENVNKFNEHDRQFTAEEYQAWEAEQKEIVKDLSWDDIYKAWLENQA